MFFFIAGRGSFDPGKIVTSPLSHFKVYLIPYLPFSLPLSTRPFPFVFWNVIWRKQEAGIASLCLLFVLFSARSEQNQSVTRRISRSSSLIGSVQIPPFAASRPGLATCDPSY